MEVSGIYSGGGGGKSNQSIDNTSKGYIDGNIWSYVSNPYRDTIIKYRQEKKPRREKN